MADSTSGTATLVPEGRDVPTRVLVLGMAHHDGTILASEVYPVAEACGQSSDQVRSCLRRLVSEGLFERHGEGRDARFVATDAGHRALGGFVERTRLAYAQDTAGKGWDRHWRLVTFAVPESRRGARDAFRDRLLGLGGAPIQHGVYVSPHRWDADVTAEADRLGLREHVMCASTDDLDLGGTTDPVAIARRLWPLDEVAARYERFIATYDGVPEQLETMRRAGRRLSDAEFLPGALVIGIKFQECFNTDPLLPPELLPRPWPGRRARDLLARSRRLGILLRRQHDRPQLFAPFDEVLNTTW
ncbi:MAG: transcriptional regulator [Acidimicrobiia bacterium]|nr:transcriptional regulator [Acidimicrobiia bacterium]